MKSKYSNNTLTTDTPRSDARSKRKEFEEFTIVKRKTTSMSFLTVGFRELHLSLGNIIYILIFTHSQNEIRNTNPQ